jgi:hypothetical protein
MRFYPRSTPVYGIRVEIYIYITPTPRQTNSALRQLGFASTRAAGRDWMLAQNAVVVICRRPSAIEY